MRQKLTATIKEVFTSTGYGFYQGFAYNITNTEMALPCVWLNPPELIELQGQRDIKASYRVILYMFVQDNGYSEDQKAEAWADMETKAIVAYNTLNLHQHINQVSGLLIKPDEYAYTSFRELSLMVEFKVEVNNCNI